MKEVKDKKIDFLNADLDEEGESSEDDDYVPDNKVLE
jgi:hypothetical protein